MSGFNFGAASGGTGGGFSFGGTPTAASTQATPAAQPGGFSFGQTANTNASTGFGAPAANTAAAASGFNFGGAPAPAATAPTATAAPGSFSFGGVAPTAAPAGTGFTGFGTAPAAAPAKPAASGGFGGFNLGASLAAPATSSVGFGGAGSTGLNLTTTAAVSTPTLSGLLGAVPAATAAPAAAAAPNAAAGFNFGGVARPAATAAPTSVAPSLATGGLGGTGLGTGLTGGLGGAGLGGVGLGAAGLGGVGLGAAGLGGVGLGGAGLTGGLGATGLGTGLTGGLGGAGLGGAGLGGAGLTGGLKMGAVSATPAAATAPTTGFTLGSLTAGTATSSAAATPASATAGFTLGATAATTQVSLSTATTTTSSTARTPTMTYHQLEEQINKWMLELDDQEKNFLQKATQVNAWDRLLIDNGDKITRLNTDVERVKIDQQRLDHELDFILAQQRELEEMLTPLEKSVEQLPPINYQQHADLEREHTYQLAENVDAQLKRMCQDLKEIIEHLNTNNSATDNNDPIYQIGKILNVHMDSIQWIDQNTSLLQRRVEEVSKQADLRRKEQERNFRLAYN